jgi:hypothetical protein
MPTKQVLAMVLATKPGAAATVLLGMTPDRLATLLLEIPPANLGRIVSAAGPREQPALIGALSPTQRRAALATLTTREVAQLLVAIGPDLAWTILGELPAETAVTIYTDLPPAPREGLERSKPHDLSVDFRAAIYRRAAVETIGRTVSRTAWLDASACDVLAELFRKSIQIAVRFRGVPLEGSDIDTEVNRVRWDTIDGLLVVTNLNVPKNVQERAVALREAGSPVDLIKWIDASDDGVLKRSLARLVG